MTTLKQPWNIYMKTMLEAGFKEQWNFKGESQTYWVFQFLREWLEQKRRPELRMNFPSNSSYDINRFIDELWKAL